MTLSSFGRALLITVSVSTLLTACNLSPEFATPSAANPAQFKEADQALEGKWVIASKDAGQVDQSKWWTIFNDQALNELQDQATEANQDLKIAAARLNQLDAVYRQNRAGLLPAINLGGNAGRGNTLNLGGKPSTNYQAQVNLSYEVDLFGRIRNQAEMARLNREAQRDLLNQSVLLIHGQVAQNYFALQALDTERDLLRQTITLREEAAKLINSRYKLGETGEQDDLRAQAELASTQAELTALDEQRAITEHALAVLIGKAPSDVTLVEKKLPESLPLIPAGIPSTVLERRPDIAAAQKQMAAANANIGIARAAFFPSLNLTAIGGLASNELGDLFKWSSRTWMLGPLFGTALSMPLFDGGRRIAGVDLAKAGYDEAVATYRQQVLVSFREVEDSLVSLRLDAQQAEQLYRAADAATKANHISDVRYKEGETSYLEVIDTQRDALSAQRAYTRVQGQRFVDTVNLIRALGGGWSGAAPAEATTVKPVEEPKILSPRVEDAPKRNITPDGSSAFAMPIPKTDVPAVKPATGENSVLAPASESSSVLPLTLSPDKK
ncbi:MAG TPA: efflux transporter outer membrane subunit [Alphaproteobacteria bacterium]